MSDTELEELIQSIQRLETKVDMLLAQPKKRSRFLWKEFVIGFVVVYVVMNVVLVGVGLLGQNFVFPH